MNFKENFTLFSVKGRLLSFEHAFKGLLLAVCQEREVTVILTIGLC